LILEAVTPEPPRLVPRPAFHQHWGNLTFLHWPVDPDLVAPLLPPGTTPDVFDGSTWVGLVPFEMSDVRILGSPALPHLSRFAETNVRLYAVDASGRRGVVFRSLEAARLLPVLAAQISYHLPYRWARMAISGSFPERDYATSRRWPGPRGASSRLRVTVGERLVPGDLEHFLTARWGLFSTFYGGRTAWAPVWHEPWPLHHAVVRELQDELVEVAGLSVSGDPHVMWTPGVQVRIGRPELLAR
jgi:uncharacterized protein YqjF (DUF2071 family)